MHIEKACICWWNQEKAIVHPSHADEVGPGHWAPGEMALRPTRLKLGLGEMLLPLEAQTTCSVCPGDEGKGPSGTGLGSWKRPVSHPHSSPGGCPAGFQWVYFAKFLDLKRGVASHREPRVSQHCPYPSCLRHGGGDKDRGSFPSPRTCEKLRCTPLRPWDQRAHPAAQEVLCWPGTGHMQGRLAVLGAGATATPSQALPTSVLPAHPED